MKLGSNLAVGKTRRKGHKQAFSLPAVCVDVHRVEDLVPLLFLNTYTAFPRMHYHKAKECLMKEGARGGEEEGST